MKECSLSYLQSLVLTFPYDYGLARPHAQLKAPLKSITKLHIAFLPDTPNEESLQSGVAIWIKELINDYILTAIIEELNVPVWTVPFLPPMPKLTSLTLDVPELPSSYAIRFDTLYEKTPNLRSLHATFSRPLSQQPSSSHGYLAPDRLRFLPHLKIANAYFFGKHTTTWADIVALHTACVDHHSQCKLVFPGLDRSDVDDFLSADLTDKERWAALHQVKFVARDSRVVRGAVALCNELYEAGDQDECDNVLELSAFQVEVEETVKTLAAIIKQGVDLGAAIRTAKRLGVAESVKSTLQKWNTARAIASDVLDLPVRLMGNDDDLKELIDYLPISAKPQLIQKGLVAAVDWLTERYYDNDIEEAEEIRIRARIGSFECETAAPTPPSHL
jgi:hypothetical protein